jgi:hypothetical protein
VRYEQYGFTGAALASGTGDSDVLPILDLTDKWVQVTGTFTATINVQASQDGTNYVTIGTTTTVGFVEVPQTCKTVKLNLSSHASGTVVATIAGRNARTE